jgi:hypothetical protein
MEEQKALALQSHFTLLLATYAGISYFSHPSFNVFVFKAKLKPCLQKALNKFLFKEFRIVFGI